MVEARQRFVGLVTLLGVIGVPATGLARIQDYQIVRLLTYKTDCDIDRLDAAPAAGKQRRYKAICRNLTFYPDGIEIVCDDPDNEQSCRIVTRPQSFDNLHALQRKD